MHSIRQNSPSITSRRSIMNSLIVFLSVVGAALAQWGHSAGPQETPEVAAARAAHLNALQAAGGHVPAPAAQSWNANPGVPQDTPEVAAAKAAHFAALAQAGSPAQQSGAYNPAPSPYNAAPQQQYNNYAPRWNGPLALPPGFDASGAPLPVQDTPEVQAERAHHLALAARAGAPAPLANQWNAPAANQWNAPAANQWNAPAANQWNAPAAHSWNNQGANQWNAPAAPAYGGYGAAPGAPADTPEVAAAKAAHFAAHQAAIGHRYRRSVLLAAPIAVAHAAPIAIAHAPILRHSILI